MTTYANDLYQSIGYDLKDERGLDFGAPLYIDYLNRAIRRLAWAFAKNKFNINKKIGTGLSLTVGLNELTLPTDFLAEDYFYVSTRTTPLKKLDGELELMKYIGDTSRGEPVNYLIRGSTLIVKPIADATYSIIPLYWYIPTKISKMVDILPFNEIFDDPIREFIVALAMNRDEYSIEIQNALLMDLEQKAISIAYINSDDLKLIPYSYPKASVRKYR
jgi:hypothetical protein